MSRIIGYYVESNKKKVADTITQKDALIKATNLLKKTNTNSVCIVRKSDSRYVYKISKKGKAINIERTT